MARRFYKDNFGIELEELARPNDWWAHGLNLYADNFWRNGFRPVEGPPRDWLPGDAFLMQFRASVANHGAIYLGDNKILHHVYGRMSNVETYSSVWRRITVAVLRHKDAHIADEPLKTLDLGTLLPERQRVMLGLEKADVG